MKNPSTKVWRTPRASCYGAFAEATTQVVISPCANKSSGIKDGIVFQGQQLECS